MAFHLRLVETKRVSDEELFAELGRVWQSLGHRPSRYEWEIHQEANSHYRTYRVRFGGWVRRVLELFGMADGEEHR